MYQSLARGLLGRLAWRQCRLSIKAWAISSAPSPVRTLESPAVTADSECLIGPGFHPSLLFLPRR